jgi:hypothetical protein
MFFGSKKVIGLDIGTSSIKMAELEVSGGRVQLKSFGFATTPASSLNGGEIQYGRNCRCSPGPGRTNKNKTEIAGSWNVGNSSDC